MSKKPNQPLDVAVGRNIALGRMSRGFSVADLAELAGLTIADLEAIERGAQRANASQQFALAAALQRSVGSLYGFGERPPSVVQQVLPVPDALRRLVAAAEQLTSDQVEALERLMTTMVKRRKSH